MKAILTYHSIDDSGSAISLRESVFEQHVRWLASGAVAVVGLTELMSWSEDRHVIAITFDDAFANFATLAWPRLKDHGFPVTLFVPTSFVGGVNNWGSVPGGQMPELSLLDWGALARLQEEGVSLGAHSRSHPDLRSLGPSALRDEIHGSVEDIERETGRRPEAFAYPYGHWNQASAAIVREAASCACTTALRPLRRSDDRHLLPRLDTFYLERPGRLERFGRMSFGCYVHGRSGMRSVGQWVRARLPR